MTVSTTSAAPQQVELTRPLHTVMVGGTVAMITVIALLVTAAWPGPDDALPTAESTPPLVEPDYGPEAQVNPEDSSLEIIEFGFTPMADLAGDTMVSWGAIVMNTSSTMTAVSGVYIEPYDTDGESLAFDTEWDLWVDIKHLMPGETIGLGSTSYIDDGDFDTLEVHIGTIEWYVPEELGNGTLTTTDIDTEWVNVGERKNYWSSDGISFPENERGDLRVTYTVTSTYSTLLDNVSVCVIYRNDDGEIIGSSRPDDVGYTTDYPPGWSIRSVETSYGPPEDLDVDRIEVYALP
ncbi:hypothetical protein FB566_2699 [Stackebrandtia endophytica]|uniref:Uncharacterized protein n=1 Tax=Stackebrandtia endophytica TaxID=1496996 RepID=A0A543AX60_9ACTN|nr:hypothetical protein [Stackebrandtia endophytica]TQL77149.1 hypothetical protein FB566_2699 [Stackebrandtia endophytica]